MDEDNKKILVLENVESNIFQKAIFVLNDSVLESEKVKQSNEHQKYIMDEAKEVLEDFNKMHMIPILKEKEIEKKINNIANNERIHFEDKKKSYNHFEKSLKKIRKHKINISINIGLTVSVILLCISIFKFFM